MIEQYAQKGKVQKNGVKFQLRISDELKHLYNQNTKTLDFQLRAQYIKNATLYEKQLDDPLPFIKKTFAWIAGIKTKHQFVIFQLQNGVWGSVDFYIENRVVLRLGNQQTILQNNLEGKRKESIAVSKNQMPYKINMEKQKSITFGDLIQMIYYVTPADGYSQIKRNGSHFSRALMKEIKKQKKGQASIIRFKLVDVKVGFQII